MSDVDKYIRDYYNKSNNFINSNAYNNYMHLNNSYNNFITCDNNTKMCFKNNNLVQTYNIHNYPHKQT
jgi:hypothetical protein